jgi:hypothetical protein
MRLIINADDFGMSRGVNLGILDGFKRGVVTSSTIMMNMPYAEEAVRLAIENRLDVGIHLVLTAGKPLSTDVPTLTGNDGNFKKRNVQLQEYNLEEVEREFRKQVERALRMGLVPTHIDSHHHIHGEAGISEIVGDLARELKVPIRVMNRKQIPEAFRDLKSPDKMVSKFYGEDLTLEAFEKILTDNMKYEVVELMCHPAYLDTYLLYQSSYGIPRVKEMDILTSDEAKEIIHRLGIELISYADLSKDPVTAGEARG